ncbi:hypothetical protein SERLA73DRAFT_158561 [Serpula lacrymans var. lacrymans S7.3]|uniref:Uncharacterized protein n=1 Tax=Serpula lacrymans var. lacrymans (strain S7.3) TaxID=936435 RepID=F8PMF7_SERL3|nr:hypothetical protein SERLA73DRAFT_158561 [Serpula lacrymans var. lacrymans S7.3]
MGGMGYEDQLEIRESSLLISQYLTSRGPNQLGDSPLTFSKTKPPYSQHRIWPNLFIFPSKFALLEVEALVSGLPLSPQIPVHITTQWDPHPCTVILDLLGMQPISMLSKYALVA